MRKMILVASILAGLMVAGCSMSRETTSTETVDHNPDPTFRDLNHYGTWVKIPDYGSVWKPFAADNFWLPYADGQWVWTDQGWMWDSNEPYGWIVYHYGYWHFTDYDGWFWKPGYNWATARVSWYNSDGYIGWAPIPPANVEQSLIYNDKYTRRIWVVVREQNFAGQNVKNYFDRTFVPGASVLRANEGGSAPDKGIIEQASNRTINVVQLIRELAGNGNHQLIKMQVQNNTQVSPFTPEDQTGTILDPDDSDTPVENPTVEDNPPVEVNPPVSEPDNPIIVPDSGPIKHHGHHYKTGLWVNGPKKHKKPVPAQTPSPTKPSTPPRTPSPTRPTTPPRNPSPVRPTMPVRNPSPARPAMPTRNPAPTSTPVSTGTSAPTRNPVPTGTSSPTRTPAPSRNPAPIKTAAPIPAPVRGNDNNSVKKDEKK
jgi:hypothetical protein